MRAVVLIGVALILGCATAPTYVTEADGRQWISIDCRQAHGNCSERALAECPQGYSVWDDGRGAPWWSGTGTQPTTGPYTDELLIRCNGVAYRKR